MERRAGTPPFLSVLLVSYLVLARWLTVARVGPTVNSVLLGGFVLLVLIAVILYYGARQATLSRQLDAETLRADAEHRVVVKMRGVCAAASSSGLEHGV